MAATSLASVVLFVAFVLSHTRIEFTAFEEWWVVSQGWGESAARRVERVWVLTALFAGGLSVWRRIVWPLRLVFAFLFAGFSLLWNFAFMAIESPGYWFPPLGFTTLSFLPLLQLCFCSEGSFRLKKGLLLALASAEMFVFFVSEALSPSSWPHAGVSFRSVSWAVLAMWVLCALGWLRGDLLLKRVLNKAGKVVVALLFAFQIGRLSADSLWLLDLQAFSALSIVVVAGALQRPRQGGAKRSAEVAERSDPEVVIG